MIEDDETRKQLNSQEKAIHDLSEPIPLTSLFVRKPCAVIMAIYMLLGAITAVTVWMNWFEPTVQTPRDYLIWSDKKTIDYDMFAEAKNLLAEGETVDGV